MAASLDGIQHLLMRTTAIVVSPKHTRILATANHAGTFRDARMRDPSQPPEPGFHFPHAGSRREDGGRRPFWLLLTKTAAGRSGGHEHQQDDFGLARVHFDAWVHHTVGMTVVRLES